MLLRCFRPRLLLDARRINFISTRFLSDGTDDDIDSFATTKKHQNIDQSFTSYPWESDDMLNTDTDTLPWETDGDDITHTLSLGQGKTQSVDPSKAELILGPIKKRTSNNKRKQANDVGAGLNNSYKELLDFKHTISVTDMFSNIESLRPPTKKISLSQLKEITKSMDRMCRRNHLIDYLKQQNPELASNLSSRVTKKVIIQAIIARLWNLKIDKLQDTNEQEVTCTINLTHKRDLFLLSSSRGFLFDHWSLMGAKLSINTATRELIVKGSQNIVDFVQTSWNEMLNGVVCKKLVLSSILEFMKSCKQMEQNVEEFQLKEEWLKLINAIQHETGAYFELIDEESQTYLVSAINKNILHSVKTEFVKMMDYQNASNKIMLAGFINDNFSDLKINDKSLPWFVRSEDMYQLVKNKPRLSKAKLTSTNLDTQTLSKKIQQLQIDVSEAEELFEFNYVKSGNEIKRDIANEGEFDEFFNIHEVTESEESTYVGSMLQKLNLASVEEKLNPNSELEFDENSKIDLASVISAKFGHILINKHSMFYFNPQIPEVLNRISSLPLMNKSSSIFGTAGGIKTNFSKHLKVKLSSDSFSNKLNNLPPMELIINLKESVVALQSFDQSRLWDLYMNESEKSVQCPLSTNNGYDYDINFINSKNSLMVYNLQDWSNHGKESESFKKIMEDENNVSLLNKQSVQKSLNLINRKTWDTRKEQDLQSLFKGIRSKTFSFAIPLKSNDSYSTFKYRVTDVALIKVLELDFDGSPLILEVEDDGNGTKFNLSLIKEDEPFNDFARKSLQLAKFLTI